MKAKRIIVLKLLLIILWFNISSCERTLEGELINMNADAGRTNNYERFGNFWKLNYFIDKPESSDSSGVIIAPLALSSSEIIAATTEGTIIYTIKSQTIWEKKLDKGQVAASGMCADREQNIYVISNLGVLYSFSLLGKLQWKFNLNDGWKELPIFSDLLAVNDGIVCGVSNGIVAKLSFYGKLLWKRMSDYSPALSFSADDKGNIFIPLTENTFGGTDSLVCLNRDGKIKWGRVFDSIRFDKPATILQNKLYIAGIYDSKYNRSTKIFSLSVNGDILWERQFSIFPRFLSIDSDGSIFFTGYNSGIGEYLTVIFALDGNGKLKWKKYYELAIPSPIIIGKDEIAFIGSTRDAIGISFLKKGGKMIRTISLSDAPVLYLQPAVTPEPVIIFGCTERFWFIRIDDTPLNKLLPW